MRSPEISSFLQERIDAGDFPSAVYLVAEKGEIVFQGALGNAVVEPETIPAEIGTIYDLASLTKPMVTGLLTARAIEFDQVELYSKIGDHVLEFKDSPIAEVTVEELATHTSGLPAWVPLYLLAKSRMSVEKVIAAQPISKGEARAVEYSDLNFIALACVIGQARPDSEFFYDVIEPLELLRTTFCPLTDLWGPPFRPTDIAASEKGSVYERQVCIEKGFLSPANAKNPPAYEGGSDLFRDYQIWGEVHDGNAWFMGGVAGHAGLFSTAEETFKIAQQFLPNYTKLLKPATCELFRNNFTPGMNEHRSIAFQLASTPESTAGTRMSPEAFGHLGFTGTSLWIDPVKERVFILLTNRTHAHPLPFTNINSVRRRFHDLANELLDILSN